MSHLTGNELDELSKLQTETGLTGEALMNLYRQRKAEREAAANKPVKISVVDPEIRDQYPGIDHSGRCNS